MTAATQTHINQRHLNVCIISHFFLRYFNITNRKWTQIPGYMLITTPVCLPLTEIMSPRGSRVNTVNTQTCQLNNIFLFLSKGLPQIAKPVLAGARPVSGNALPSGGFGPDPGPAGCPSGRLPVMYSGGADKHSSVLLHCYHILRVPKK